MLGGHCTSGLAAYSAVWQKRVGRLREKYGERYASAIPVLLEQLEQAGSDLLPLWDGRRHLAADYLNALFMSLSRLGMGSRYAQDDAGASLLARFDGVRNALANRRLRIRGPEFRAWLARNLERTNFQPPLTGRNVELMGFAESRLYRFDALVIAGAVAEHLLGPGTPPLFFNDGVRRQLNLPTPTIRRNSLFHDFRRLLEAAPTVLVTRRREQNG